MGGRGLGGYVAAEGGGVWGGVGHDALSADMGLCASRLTNSARRQSNG